jgi:hypothetical protein
LQREGFDVARCTVARLMRAMGLEGIICTIRSVRLAPIAATPAIGQATPLEGP